MQVKPITALVRLLFNCVIIVAVFYNPDLMELICGPFTLAPSHRTHLLRFIIFIEVLRVFYFLFANLLAKLPAVHFMKSLCSVKYILLFLLKTALIFEETHRKKYYLHTLLLELSIIIVAVLLDCFRKQNITEAGQLLIIEGLHRLALVYELTQTFCPNLILYYLITNFIVFIVSQIEAQYKYKLSDSLYVKNDIYRFIFMSLIFFGMVSIAQLSYYGFKMLIIFLATLKFYWTAVRAYNNNNFASALNNLIIVAILFSGLELLFAAVPPHVLSLTRQTVEL